VNLRAEAIKDQTGVALHYQFANEIPSNKTCSTGDENVHEINLGDIEIECLDLLAGRSLSPTKCLRSGDRTNVGTRHE
jgi:hypothetical protein